MKYKNIKTGAIIEVASVCSGENWVEVVEKPAKKTTASTTKTTKKGVSQSE